MHLVQWNTFGLHSNQTRTLVHFFPSAGGMTAPYPAQCKITAFGEAIGLKSVTLDGGRVSQPDGVCIDDLFPALESEKAAAVGLVIELSTMQPRLDIGSSGCIIEFVTDGFSARFRPSQAGAAVCSGEGEAPAETAPLGLAVKDKYTRTSIFVLNPSETEMQLSLQLLQRGRKAGVSPVPLDTRALAPYSVREVLVGDNNFNEAFSFEQPYGVQQYLPIVHEGSRIAQLVCYVVYRDASTGCPISVCAL